MATNILASLLVKISGDTAGFAGAMKQAQGQLAQFTGAVNKMGAAVGIGFGAFQAVSIVKSAIGVIADFEHQMQTVRAITGATGEEFEALKQSALDLGASTRYTAQQVAELQTEYGRLGFTTAEILAATEATLDLATATGEDLAKAADVAGSTVRGFGLSADDTRRVVDVMAESFNKSALGLENFSEAMKFVAPIAAQANISVEETTALLATLADAGIRGSLAGTSLRKIMTDLGGESGTLSEKLAKLAAKGLTGAEAMSEVGRTAYASLLVLAENTKKTEETTKALENAAGAGAKAAKIMGDDLAGDLVLLSSAYDGLILSFSEGGGVLREVAQAFTSILNAATQMVKGGSAISDFFKPIVDQLTGPLRALGFLAKSLTEASDKVEDHGDKLKAIESTVQAAFDSGNIEAYIKALDQNIHKDEIILAIRKRQAEEAAKAAEANKKAIEIPLAIIPELEEKLKKLEEQRKASFSVTEIGQFNVKIQELRDKLALLNLAGTESGFLKNLDKGITSFTPKEAEEPVNPFEALNEDEAKEKAEAMFQPWIDKILQADAAGQVFNQNEETRTQQQIAQKQALIKKQQEQTDAAVEYGSIIGSAIGSAISGEKSLVQTVKSATVQIIKALLARAMAKIIESAAGTGPPPVAIALAAAGVAAIGALFSKHTGVSGGGGGGASIGGQATQNVSRIPTIIPATERIEITGESRIQGDDIVTSYENTNYRRQRTG